MKMLQGEGFIQELEANEKFIDMHKRRHRRGGKGAEGDGYIDFIGLVATQPR